MNNRTCARFRLTLLTCALSIAVPAATAQHLPAAAPTTLAPTPVQQAPVVLTRAQSAPTRARIQVHNNVATVSADNSSLNQILRELADRAGITITGGVADERVFGNYGPADVTTILNMLLEGTGSNMLLLENAHDQPRQLLLTPRGGGPTPPSPPSVDLRNGDHDRDDDDTPPQQVRNVDQRKGHATDATAPPAPAAAQRSVPANAPAASDPAQQSPNGVKTPAQIYEQLLKLQQTPAPAPK